MSNTEPTEPIDPASHNGNAPFAEEGNIVPTSPESLKALGEIKDALTSSHNPDYTDAPFEEIRGGDAYPDGPVLVSDELPDGVSITPSHVILPDEFNFALIGHTISATEKVRFAYSINKIAEREQRIGNCDIDEARERIFELVRAISADHGECAPLFIDDAISTQEKPLIFLPDGSTNQN